MEALVEYGLFLAKTITLLFGILIAVSAVLALAQKNKKQDGSLILSDLNEKYAEISSSLQAETLPKGEGKKWVRTQKKEVKAKKSQDNLSRLFVIRFEGDVRASAVEELREIISAIVEVANKKDKVLLILESAGGFVHGYGLAASQLQRLRQKGLHLTVAIDKLAASGGYLMACVAQKIIAAPFAIVGSIGVMAQLPNFHRLLEKNDIEVELHTAGEYKRTLTLFGKNTEKGRKKFQEELEETHLLFKEHLFHHRPQIDIAQVATGEHWHALHAIKLNLIDEIETSDDFILSHLKAQHVFEISYEKKKSLSEKLTTTLSQLGVRAWHFFLQGHGMTRS